MPDSVLVLGESLVDSEGSASYEFDVHAGLAEPAVAADRIHVHTGSIGALLAPSSDVVAQAIDAHAAQATVSYDVNARPAVTGTGAGLVAGVERLAGMAELVKASDEDLEVVYSEMTLETAGQRLLGLGSAGAVCFTREAVVDVDGRGVAGRGRASG